MQTIDGLTYLLVTDTRGNENVTRYTRAEMDEVFLPTEQKALAQGGQVFQRVKGGTVRWVDMIAAARCVR